MSKKSYLVDEIITNVEKLAKGRMNIELKHTIINQYELKKSLRRFMIEEDRDIINELQLGLLLNGVSKEPLNQVQKEEIIELLIYDKLSFDMKSDNTSGMILLCRDDMCILIRPDFTYSFGNRMVFDMIMLPAQKDAVIIPLDIYKELKRAHELKKLGLEPLMNFLKDLYSMYYK